MVAVVACAAVSASARAAERPPLVGVSHIAFHVSDVPKARAFYGGLLGYEEVAAKASPEGRVRFRINGRQYVEIVPGPATSKATVASMVELLEKVGKKPVFLGREATGFVANRLQMVFRERFDRGAGDPDPEPSGSNTASSAKRRRSRRPTAFPPGSFTSASPFVTRGPLTASTKTSSASPRSGAADATTRTRTGST